MEGNVDAGEQFYRAPNRYRAQQLGEQRRAAAGTYDKARRQIRSRGIVMQRGRDFLLVRFVSLPDVDGRLPIYSVVPAASSRDCSSFTPSGDEEPSRLMSGAMVDGRQSMMGESEV